MTYARFIHGLDLVGIEIDRKVLADIAGTDLFAFKAIAEKFAPRWLDGSGVPGASKLSEPFGRTAGGLLAVPLLPREVPQE